MKWQIGREVSAVSLHSVLGNSPPEGTPIERHPKKRIKVQTTQKRRKRDSMIGRKELGVF